MYLFLPFGLKTFNVGVTTRVSVLYNVDQKTKHGHAAETLMTSRPGPAS